MELNPGNHKVVHHAFIYVDRTRQSRILSENSPEPGFGGMNAPAEMPDGQFLTWQPGKLFSVSPEGSPWRVGPGDDLVVQMHFRPDVPAEKERVRDRKRVPGGTDVPLERHSEIAFDVAAHVLGMARLLRLGDVAGRLAAHPRLQGVYLGEHGQQVEGAEKLGEVAGDEDGSASRPLQDETQFEFAETEVVMANPLV